MRITFAVSYLEVTGSHRAVLDDDEKRRRIAAFGRERVQEFRWDRAAIAFERILKQSS
jgi:glycosyltransferase involved in cell wall biosynthesis